APAETLRRRGPARASAADRGARLSLPAVRPARPLAAARRVDGHVCAGRLAPSRQDVAAARCRASLDRRDRRTACGCNVEWRSKADAVLAALRNELRRARP